MFPFPEMVCGAWGDYFSYLNSLQRQKRPQVQSHAVHRQPEISIIGGGNRFHNNHALLSAPFLVQIPTCTSEHIYTT